MAAICEAMHDLTIILVSHNGERWLRPCLTSVFEHAGDCNDRRCRRQQRRRRHGRGRPRLSQRQTHPLREPWFRSCEQPRAADVDRAVRALPERRHRNPRRDVRGTRRCAGRSSNRRTRRCTSSLRRRSRCSDDQAVPERNPLAWRSSRLRALSVSRELARRTRARPRDARPRVLVRLDIRIVPRRPPRSSSRAPASSTSASSSTARNLISVFGSSRRDGTSAIFPS